jgi:hypothetical protein
MSNQIFKKNIPNEELFKLLETNCMKSEKYFLFNNISFKKGIFNGTIEKFLSYCNEYYHISKKKYLERKLTYNGFTTVLRQICKFNKITYTSQILYDKSSYCIVYFVYF